MARFAALLRGVNVGPTTKVPMPELRELLAELGATDIATHLNSGNATFSLHASPKVIDALLTQAISERFGFAIPTVTRTKTQLEKALAIDPFDGLATDESKYVIAFLSGRPKPSVIKPVTEADYPDGELAAANGKEFYVYSPAGVHKSKSLKALERAHAVDHFTGRNVRTVKKLIEVL